MNEWCIICNGGTLLTQSILEWNHIIYGREVILRQRRLCYFYLKQKYIPQRTIFIVNTLSRVYKYIDG